MTQKPITHLPHWEKSLITNVEKTYNSWVKGFDLSSANDEVISKFCIYLDSIFSNKTGKYNTSIISQLIKKDVVFTEDQIIKIGPIAYRFGSAKKEDLLRSFKEEKVIQIIGMKNTDCDIVAYLNSLTIKDYERELVFLVSGSFDSLIEKYNLSEKIDVLFMNQIYATTTKPLDLIKFIFFTMSQQDILKKDPLFMVLYNYLSNASLDDLYNYLRKY